MKEGEGSGHDPIGRATVAMGYSWCKGTYKWHPTYGPYRMDE